MRLSVIIPVRNEMRRLPAVLAGIEAQTLSPDEVIVADGMSTDGSRAWLEAAAATRPWLSVVANPRRTVPAALNLALRAASGDYVARMDAHADYAPDYLEHLVGVLNARSDVIGVGGAMDTAGLGSWGQAIAATLRRPFGMGGARHRIGGGPGPIEHVFTGCYRRRTLLVAGGYDERLLANEDFEMDVRLRLRGGTIWLHPPARSAWYVRESLPALTRQMFRYGYYKAITVRLHPRSVKARQLAPPLLVIGLAGLTLLAPWRGATAIAAYLGTAGAAGALAAHADSASMCRGAVVPPVVHLCWGLGMIVGLTRFSARRQGRHRGG